MGWVAPIWFFKIAPEVQLWSQRHRNPRGRDLDSSVGYAVISNMAAKVPMVGAGDHDDLGTGPGGHASGRNEKRALYQLSEAGVSATFTVRMIKYSVLELDG
jgi:hypothetical protein